MKRPSDKDEELETALQDPQARARVERLTERLLSFAETTSKEEDNRRYFFARGHEFAVVMVDHGRALVDIRAPRPGTLSQDHPSLRQRMHEGAHREGWVLVPLETEDDIRAAEEIARMGYEEVLGMAPTIAVRKERPLEAFDAPLPRKAGGRKAGGKTAPSKRK